MSAAPSCSVASQLAGEQLAGSAPSAVAWLALEQDGPWGANALTSSHLDPELGAQIERRAGEHGIRPCLIRRPGRHADRRPPEGHRLLVAFTVPGRTWLAEATVDSPERILDLDFAAIAAGIVPEEAARTDRPHLLVCTNGTRDVCCAVRGRPLAAEAATAYPGQVWEVTHTSGHRFAPTAVLLPYGTLHGRLVDGTSLLAAAMRGRTVLEGSRGRSCWSPAGQVAEIEVRRLTGDLDLDAFTLASSGGDDVVVRHRDGRRWRVTTRIEDTGISRAESCGKEPVPLRRVVTDVRELPR